MPSILILGAGGHARVVADILLRAHEQAEQGAEGDNSTLLPAGFVDDDPDLAGTTILGLPVVGSIDRLGDIEHDAVIVAVGDNHARARIFSRMEAAGERIANAIHPGAVVAPDVLLGQGVMVCAGVVVNTGAVIGDDVILNTGCTVDHHNEIGPHAHLAPGVHLGGHVRVGEGALTGIGSTAIPGASIGDWAIVGAGSVVTKEIPPHTTCVGAPTRVIEERYETSRS